MTTFFLNFRINYFQIPSSIVDTGRRLDHSNYGRWHIWQSSNDSGTAQVSKSAQRRRRLHNQLVCG